MNDVFIRQKCGIWKMPKLRFHGLGKEKKNISPLGNGRFMTFIDELEIVRPVIMFPFIKWLTEHVNAVTALSPLFGIVRFYQWVFILGFPHVSQIKSPFHLPVDHSFIRLNQNRLNFKKKKTSNP